VTLGEFFRTLNPTHAAVIRADARPVVESEWSRARIEAIGPISEDSQPERVVITLKAAGPAGQARMYEEPNNWRSCFKAQWN
jgi:hypothetical protein